MHSRAQSPLDAPERPCPGCLHSFRYAWAHAILIPIGIVVDLCPKCSRVLRYGNEDERKQLAAMLIAPFCAEEMEQ